MKIANFFIATLLLLTAARPALADISVRHLYDAQSFIPGFYIPFQVTSGAETVTAVSADWTAAAGTTSTCKAAQDPFRSSVYLLHCNGAATAYLVLSVGQGASAQTVRVGPIAVSLAADKVPISPTSPTQDPTVAEGQRLFTSVYGCATCHHEGGIGKVLATPTVSVAYLRNGINTYGSSMTPTAVSVTDADLAKIVVYLKANP